MTQKPKDIPAFPSKDVKIMVSGNKTVEFPIYHKGMTLRDYFASKIITGLVTGCPGFIGTKEGIDNYSPYAKGGCNSALAERAYVLADAMLNQREL